MPSPFRRKTGRPFPKTSAHINQGRTRLRVMPKPLRLAGKHVAGTLRLSLLGKQVVLSQNIARTSIKGARASRVMPKPLRLAGKYVAETLRLSLLKKTVAFFPKHRAHINQGRTRLRVMPKPLRLAGKHVAGTMRLSLLKKTVVLSQNIRAHQSRAHAPARDAEAAPTRGKTCRGNNAAFFA